MIWELGFYGFSQNPEGKENIQMLSATAKRKIILETGNFFQRLHTQINFWSHYNAGLVPDFAIIKHILQK